MIPAVMLGVCMVMVAVLLVTLSGSRGDNQPSAEQQALAKPPTIRDRPSPHEPPTPVEIVRERLQITKKNAALSEEQRCAELESLVSAVERIAPDQADAAELRQLRHECQEALLAARFGGVFDGPLPTEPVARAKAMIARIRDLGFDVTDKRLAPRLIDMVRSAGDSLRNAVLDARLLEHPSIPSELTADSARQLLDGLQWLEGTAAELSTPDLFDASHATALGRLMLSTGGGTAAARKRFDAAVKADPTLQIARILRAYMAMQTDDNATAISDFSHVLESSDNPPTDVGVNLANCLRMVGDFNRAIAVCTRTIELHPDCWRAYVNRAWAQEKVAGKDAAISDFRNALQLCDDASWQQRISRELTRLGVR